MMWSKMVKVSTKIHHGHPHFVHAANVTAIHDPEDSWLDMTNKCERHLQMTLQLLMSNDKEVPKYIYFLLYIDRYHLGFAPAQ